MQLNGSDIILECLLEQGVDTVFGYPGGAVLNIYDALYKYSDKITHIITAHEQAACHAADGYSRSTGKTGVVIATSGPGATNLVTGIATAFMDSVPLIAITGNVSTDLLGLNSFQEVDITGITKPITKKNFIVKNINNLAKTLREAFFIANDGRKGPVLIDIPKDISAAVTDFQNAILKPHLAEDFSCNSSEIDTAVELMKSAKKPFIYAGGGVISAGAEELLKAFVERLDAPISLSLMGKCAFDNRSDYFVGMLGMHGTKTSSLVLGECDLMVIVGSRLSDRVTCDTKTFANGTKIIHIDIDSTEIGKNVSVQHQINGDIADALEKICQKLPPQFHKDWIEKVQGWQKSYPLFQSSDDENAVLPQFVLETLDELTDGEAILTTEVGQHQMWAAQYYKFRKKRSFLSSGGLGTMGYGLGAAIGAKVGNPEKSVINAAGDGSFFMNMNELSTIAKFQIPVIELVFDNGVLGMVRQWQKLFYDGRFSQTTIERQTDFKKLAAAFGIEFFEIQKKSDVKNVLKKALACGKPVLIDCKIDKDINVLPMVPAGASILEPILEINSREEQTR